MLCLIHETQYHRIGFISRHHPVSSNWFHQQTSSSLTELVSSADIIQSHRIGFISRHHPVSSNWFYQQTSSSLTESVSSADIIQSHRIGFISRHHPVSPNWFHQQTSSSLTESVSSADIIQSHRIGFISRHHPVSPNWFHQQTSSSLFEVVSSADIKNLSVLPPHYNTRVLEAFLDAPEMSCIVHTQRRVANILGILVVLEVELRFLNSECLPQSLGSFGCLE